jgi:hypothetical protein
MTRRYSRALRKLEQTKAGPVRDALVVQKERYSEMDMDTRSLLSICVLCVTVPSVRGNAHGIHELCDKCYGIVNAL